MNLSASSVAATERSMLMHRQIPSGGQTLEPGRDVLSRSPATWVEPRTRFPQNIFMVRLGERIIVGRKLLSSRHEAGELLELHCSAITASHVLGLFDGFRESADDIRIDYFPYSSAERRGVIASIAASPRTEIIFPFIYLTETGERQSPEKGWSLEIERAENMGRGETDLRSFTAEMLRTQGDQYVTFYDPACSTGEFLSKISEEWPSTLTVGQDLSQEMVDYAQNVVHRVHHGDAKDPAVPDASASVVFCRFLNSEVVSTERARALLRRLRKVVAVGGLLVVFGHTPVLIRATEIVEDMDFELLRASGTNETGTAVFQYYLARRIK